MIGVIAYPGIHFFAAFKNSSFDKQRFKFYRIEFSIAGFYFFFPHITDIQVIHFVIQEHIKRDLIVHFVFIKVDIAGIIHRTYYVLYTVGYFKNTLGAYCCTGGLVKGYIIIYLVSTFINIAYKFIWH